MKTELILSDRGSSKVNLTWTAPVATDTAGPVSYLENIVTPVRQHQLVDPGTYGPIISIVEDQSLNNAFCQLFLNAVVPRCPLLSVPVGVSFSPSTCPTVYGGTCQVNCITGYTHTPNISSTVTCELTNSNTGEAAWTSDPAQHCTEIRCPALAAPSNGSKSGCQGDPPSTVAYATDCGFQCNTGYQGSGSPNRTCQLSEAWSGTPYTCNIVTCPRLTADSSVAITGSRCTTSPVYNDLCSISCVTNGYSLDPSNTPTTTRCAPGGTWSNAVSALLTCTDVTSPRYLSCPPSVRLVAARGSLVATLTANVTASDNSGVVTVTRLVPSSTTLQAGDTAVVYRAVDGTNNTAYCNFTATLTVRRCGQITAPSNGYLTTSCADHYGSTCNNVACNSGYRLVNFAGATCDMEDGEMTWTGLQSTQCQLITCAGLSIGPDVTVSPAVCSNSRPRLGVTCSFQCEAGYTQLYGDTSQECVGYDNWNGTYTPLNCSDTTPPSVSFCPSNIFVEKASSGYANVTWTQPRASDSSNKPLTMTVSPSGISSPYMVAFETTVIYTFSDSAGNTASCPFTIKPYSSDPPTVNFCPSSIVNDSSTSTISTISWSTPNFTDPDNLPMTIMTSYPEDRGDFRWGVHLVRYTATRQINQKAATCEFNITVSQGPCPPLITPQNGSMTCFPVLGGAYCQVVCSTEYELPRSGSNTFVCSPVSGLWAPSYPPACVASRYPDVARSTCEYESAIVNTTLYPSIQQAVDDFLSSQILFSCSPTKKSISPYASTLYTSTYVTVDIVYGTALNHSQTQTQAVGILNECVSNVTSNTAALNSYLAGVGVTLTITRVTCSAVQLLCPVGTLVLNAGSGKCAGCATGTFYNTSLTNCQDCPLGTYTDLSGELSCTQCPVNMSTANTRSFSSDNCTEICPVGSYGSGGGVKPCVVCDVGSYQPSAGQTVCLQCATGRTTLGTGSTNVSHCLEFCKAGQHSTSGYAPCTPCAQGSYQADVQASVCIQCPGGNTTRQQESASLDDCQEIDFCAEEGGCENGGTCTNTLIGMTCDCAEGYLGNNCSVPLYFCIDSSCDNGGTCSANGTGVYCSCPPGYSDADCSVILDPCENDPCSNNASCSGQAADFTCACQPGWTDATCQTDERPCYIGTPCQNGGQCLNEGTNYTCECVDGYEGVNCSVMTDYCRSAPCVNGGTCSPEFKDYNCTCLHGYSGASCEVDLDLCQGVLCPQYHRCEDFDTYYNCTCNIDPDCDPHSPCEANPCVRGNCSSNETILTGNYTCDCPQFYIGDKCQYASYPCDSSPCANGGSCTSLTSTSYSCQCPIIYTGTNCDSRIDYCASAPCQNNGTCENVYQSLSVGGSSCVCSQEYNGTVCEDHIPPCTAQVVECFNGGSCVNNGTSDWSCNCTNDFSGTYCQTPPDYCQSSPCGANGICSTTNTSYDCTCKYGYTGRQCDSQIPVCDLVNLNCQNGGHCVDSGNDTASCNCTAEYTGELCGDPRYYCTPALCQNNGTCNENGTTPYCTCERGWDGDSCEQDSRYCTSSPCVNAQSCIEGYVNRTCICHPGWQGDACDVLIPACSNVNCLNGATCEQYTATNFSCVCSQGYTGDLCQTEIDYCASSPCANGAACNYTTTGHTCSCPSSGEWVGRNCDVRVSPCASTPCLCGGQCIDPGSGTSFNCVCGVLYTGNICETYVDPCSIVDCNEGDCVTQEETFLCRCPTGLNGTYCTNDIDECASTPCKNGASCAHGRGNYTCTCAVGYEGLDCSIISDNCPGMCQNGAGCTNGVNTFTCSCAAGYSGVTCTVDIDDCQSHGCQNNATCQDGVNEYTCQCAPGYLGDTCQLTGLSDYDAILTADSISYEVPIPVQRNMSQFYLTAWILYTDPSTSGHILSLYDTAGVVVLSLSATRGNISVTIATRQDIVPWPTDGRWHSLGVSHNGTSLAISIDGDEVLVAPSSLNMFTATHLVLGRPSNDSSETALGHTISKVHMWDWLYDDRFDNHSISCDAEYMGSIIAWPSFEQYLTGVIRRPTFCDDFDNCQATNSSTGCLNDGQCIDGMDSITCRCLEGFSGAKCEDNIDDCADNACDNDAQCNDGIANYTCSCTDGFTGRYCDLEIVDGEWGEWQPWTNCTADCGNGTRWHERFCDNPTPSAGGASCNGSSNVTEACNTQICPSCLVVSNPVGGAVICNIVADGGSNCTLQCRDPTYTFAPPALDYYACGPSTNYIWSHEEPSNPTANFPACQEGGSQFGSISTLTGTIKTTDCTSVGGIQNNLAQLLAAICSIQPPGTCSSGVGISQGSGCTGRRRRSYRDRFQHIYKRQTNSGSNPDSTVTFRVTLTGGNSSEVANSSSTVQSSILSTNISVNGQSISVDPSTLTSETEVNCSAGYVGVSTECVPCAGGTYYNNGSCEGCPQGYYQNQTGQLQCIQCPEGTITLAARTASPDNCVNVTCEAGTYYDVDTDECTDCDTGTYQPQAQQAQCIECPDDKTTLGGAANVSDCFETCSAGDFFNTDSQQCEGCTYSYYQDKDGQVECEPCDDDNVTLSTGASSADECVYNPCEEGTYFVNGSCEDCVVNFYQNASGQVECTECPEGLFTNSTGTADLSECLPASCEPGNYLILAELRCVACAIGYHQNKTDATSCEQCPESTTTESEGTASQELCITVDCSEGTYFINSSCHPCPLGTYQSKVGQRACVTCPKGNKTLTTGSTTVDSCNITASCPAGTYIDDSGQCSECPINTYQDVPNQYTCTDCPAGSFTLYTGLASASDCRNVLIVVGGCQSGEYFTGLSCIECPRGQFQDKANQRLCESCPASYTTKFNGSISETNCTILCGPGSYFENDTCVSCPADTYKDAAGNHGCTMCPTGTETSSNSTGAHNLTECLPVLSVVSLIVEFRILNIEYSDRHSVRGSQQFQEVENETIPYLQQAFKSLSEFKNVRIDSIRAGSIIVAYEVTVSANDMTLALQLILPIYNATLEGGQLGNLTLDKDYYNVRNTSSEPTASTSTLPTVATSTLSAGAIVGITLGSVLFLGLLAVGIIVVVKIKLFSKSIPYDNRQHNIPKINTVFEQDIDDIESDNKVIPMTTEALPPINATIPMAKKDECRGATTPFKIDVADDLVVEEPPHPATVPAWQVDNPALKDHLVTKVRKRGRSLSPINRIHPQNEAVKDVSEQDLPTNELPTVSTNQMLVHTEEDAASVNKYTDTNDKVVVVTTNIDDQECSPFAPTESADL